MLNPPKTCFGHFHTKLMVPQMVEKNSSQPHKPHSVPIEGGRAQIHVGFQPTKHNNGIQIRILSGQIIQYDCTSHQMNQIISNPEIGITVAQPLFSQSAWHHIQYSAQYSNSPYSIFELLYYEYRAILSF